MSATPKPLAVFLLLFGLPLAARAQDGIHRCVGTDGVPVYTDRACAAVQANPVSVASSAGTPALATNAAPAPARCITDVAQLKQSISEAFASGSATRLSGLMLWQGYGRDHAIADIRSLQSLLHESLLGIDSDTAADRPPGQTTFTVRTAGNDPGATARTTHFSVEQRADCLWLHPAD